MAYTAPSGFYTAYDAMTAVHKHEEPIMTQHRYGYQTDQHRRNADTLAAQRIIERTKQAHRNQREWLRRAKVAIDDGRLDQAIALIEQAKGEVT